MTAKNDITGDSIKSRTSNKKYEDGWDRIFGNKKDSQKPIHPAETRYPHLKEENKSEQ